jgi:alpha-L-rhamnosidase
MFDLMPDGQKSRAVGYLVENIRRRGNHLSTGFLGTPFLCHVLYDNGNTDVAYDLLLQETFPSWLYPVKMGATTIWERWDGMKPDSTFQNKSMNSFNHYAYGAIGDWMYRVVAGMEIGSPGYKQIIIKPQPDARLDYAKATFESSYGKIESGWEINDGILKVSVVIPPNTRAEITLPKTSLGKVTENGKPIAQIYRQAKEINGNVVLEVGSGSYEFYYNTSLAVKIKQDAPEKLAKLLTSLAAKEKNQLLKKHFETVALFTMDTTHGYQISEEDVEDASRILNFFQNEGSKWDTYVDGPRPLMMSFKSPTDGKYSYYWLFLPKDFDKKKKDYPFYMELHGSGGGSNNNPRKMLYHPLQPEVAGVTSQGYRKEGLYIYPWGRGDRGYRDIAETDIFEVLADFDKMFNTDPKRQYLYGFSMGGGGTFRIALKSLDRWTAIGVYSGAMRNPTLEEASKFKNIPVWMTWGALETRLTEVNTRLKDLFIEAGVEVKWTQVEEVGHKYLGEYQEDLMNWFNTKIKK